MLTVEEREFYSKLNIKLDRIANSLEVISKSLKTLTVFIEKQYGK